MKCRDQLASSDLHASQDHDSDNSVGHEHGGDVVAGDAHAHVESGNDVSTAAVAGAIVEHGHSDTHEEEDHGDHH